MRVVFFTEVAGLTASTADAMINWQWARRQVRQSAEHCTDIIVPNRFAQSGSVPVGVNDVIERETVLSRRS